MSCFTYFEATSAAGGGLPQPALIPVGTVAPEPDVELLASAPGLTVLPLVPAPLLPAPELVETAPLAVAPLAPAALVAPLAPAALVVPLGLAVPVAPEMDPMFGAEPVAPEDEPLVSAASPELLVPGVLLEQAVATNMIAHAARGR